MSSAKEKAESLINKYIDLSEIWTDTAVLCAKVHVNGIIEETLTEYTDDENHARVLYWNEVLTELKNYKP